MDAAVTNTVVEILPHFDGFVYPNESGEQPLWGVLIVLYPYITGLVAGAFIMASLVRVFRVKALEPYAEQIRAESGDERLWSTYLALREEIEGVLGTKGIFANVDSITGLLYHPIGLPVSSFPIPFCLAIQTGWMAHCLEYLPDGKVISPGAVYLASE